MQTLTQRLERTFNITRNNIFIPISLIKIMQLDKAIQSRKSVRRFHLDKKPDWRKIIRAIDAVRFSPTAGGLSVIKFIIVDDPKKIQALKEASQQDFVGTAKYIVVVTSDTSQLKRMYDDRAEMFARQQAGAAIQNFLLKLTEFDLATCWVGYFDEDQVRRTVAVPEDNLIEAFFPIGIETKEKTKSVVTKPELENIVRFNTWKNKFMEPKQRASQEGM
jgi:nitroreductase